MVGISFTTTLFSCTETKRRCGFFLEVFGLSLPDYLDCDLFPESKDTDVCVGHNDVIEAEVRAQKPGNTSCNMEIHSL